jgi:nucleoside 2-deoxyribosyltransferase
MKIYLSGSISGGREKLATYIQIKNILESLGHSLTSPQTADPKVTAAGEGDGENLTARQIFERDIRQILESDLMIADVTIPSLGVGYEIAYAIEKNLPILCLFDQDHNSKRLSAMIGGNTYPKFKVAQYTVDTLSAIITDYLNTCSKGKIV